LPGLIIRSLSVGSCGNTHEHPTIVVTVFGDFERVGFEQMTMTVPLFGPDLGRHSSERHYAEWSWRQLREFQRDMSDGK
jgi:hypothetical protein